MKYTIKQLADMSGVSVRTLHYYDEINLLNPQEYGENGYREYGDAEALSLQQILFFRELDFPLDKIKEITDKPNFDLANALRTHQELLNNKIDQLRELTKTIDKTINKLNAPTLQSGSRHGVVGGEGTKMSTKDLYKGFSEKKQKEHETEIEEKYGKSEAGATMILESKRNVARMSKEQIAAVQEELKSIHEEIARSIDKGYDSAVVQAQIAKHREWLEHFYSCSDEVHMGLGRMYVEHPDFRENYKKFLGDEKGAEFMSKAIDCYCKNRNL